MRLRPTMDVRDVPPDSAANADYNDRSPLARATSGAPEWIVDYMWMWFLCLFEEVEIARNLERARWFAENALELMSDGDPMRAGCEAAVNALPLPTRTLLDVGEAVTARVVRWENPREQVSVEQAWILFASEVLGADEIGVVLGRSRALADPDRRPGELKAIRQLRRRARGA